jgi:hypothetical protein
MIAQMVMFGRASTATKRQLFVAGASSAGGVSAGG